MYRNHKNTRPPARATTAPTTIIVTVVVLESLDDEAVCEGSGVVWVAVAAMKGLVVRPKVGWVVVGIAVAAAATRFVVGVGGFGDPSSEKKKAVEVKRDRPQARRTVEPPSNRYFPTFGVALRLFALAHEFGYQNSVLKGLPTPCPRPTSISGRPKPPRVYGRDGKIVATRTVCYSRRQIGCDQAGSAKVTGESVDFLPLSLAI